MVLQRGRRFREIMERQGRNDLILPIHYGDADDFGMARRLECYDPDSEAVRQDLAVIAGQASANGPVPSRAIFRSASIARNRKPVMPKARLIPQPSRPAPHPKRGLPTPAKPESLSAARDSAPSQEALGPWLARNWGMLADLDPAFLEQLET